MRYPVLQTVLVNTKTGHTFRGVLRRKCHDYLVLVQAVMIQQVGEKQRALMGELLIPADNVDFLQVVGHDHTIG